MSRHNYETKTKVAGSTWPLLDVDRIRADFPLLGRKIDGRSITYLDSAATSLKPRCVIDAVVEFYESYTANINRGVHQLGDEATERFEAARDTIAGFINAEANDIVFTRNTTEAINLVALNVPRGAKVLYSIGDHHSNLLPWCQHNTSDSVGITDEGMVDMAELKSKLETGQFKLLAMAQITNAFGALNPVAEVIEFAHANDCQVFLDASQSAPHIPLDVVGLDCDFLCFSGHKMCGPSGVGVLYGKREVMEQMAPVQFGGSMVTEVHQDGFSINDLPWRFEAGTPNIEGVLGLAAACDYLDAIGMDRICAYEQELVGDALRRLAEIPRLTLFGPRTSENRGSLVSFAIDGIEAHGLARMLSNGFKVFVRSGFHCAQPAHEFMQILPTTRASFSFYNNAEDLDRLVDALNRISQSIGR